MKQLKLNPNQIKILQQLYRNETSYPLSGSELRKRSGLKPLIFLPNIRALDRGKKYVENHECKYIITEKGIAALKKEVAEGELQKLGVFK